MMMLRVCAYGGLILLAFPLAIIGGVWGIILIVERVEKWGQK